MKQKVNNKKKTEDSIKALMRRYAEWKEKHEKTNDKNFEQYLTEEQEALDFENKF